MVFTNGSNLSNLDSIFWDLYLTGIGGELSEQSGGYLSSSVNLVSSEDPLSLAALCEVPNLNLFPIENFLP